MDDYKSGHTYRALSKSRGSVIFVQKIQTHSKAGADSNSYGWYEVFVNKKNNIVTMGDPVHGDDIRILPG